MRRWLGGIALLVLSIASTANAQQTVIDETDQSCLYLGSIIGLDPNGDNYLSVRRRPNGPAGLQEEADRLFSDDRVCVASTSGHWLNVKYNRSNRMYSGWIFDRYVARYPVKQPKIIVVPNESNTTVTTNQTVNNTINQTVNNGVIIQLKSEAVDVKGQIAILNRVIDEQKKMLQSGGDSSILNETINSVNERIVELKKAYDEKANTLANTYSTPIKPDDADLNLTARKMSEIYPKVPYYIPGTPETGEFWIEPIVSDTGTLIFRFKFVDVNSTAAEKVRSSIEMKPEELEKTQKALMKLVTNSKVAHDKKIRRKLDVRLECFPIADCPPEGQKIDAKASTEIIFSINDDGSTSGRIQRNKGKYEEGYNVSVKSGLVLQAYINHVLTEGKADFEAGSASQEDLKKLFQ